MFSFNTKILEVKQETFEVKTLRFDTTGQNFEFKPGQYIILTLQENMSHDLSISSSPTKQSYIEISKKITESEFSKKLASLKKGDTVKIMGPFGKFFFDKTIQKAIFLSGGIGITPLRSMIEYAADKKLSTKIVLFYSNKTPEQIAFFEELKNTEMQNKNFKVVHTITRLEESNQKWEGHVGRIDGELIAKHAPDFLDYTFFICGPPSMVKALKTLCESLAIPKEQIKIEEFTGYP